MLNRREFIKQSGKAGIEVAGVTALSTLSSCSFFKSPADISIVSGEDYFNNTMKAIDAIGGIGRFVPSGAKVGLLINSDFEVAGAFVNPDIAISAIKLIHDAGAKEICCLQKVKMEYWERSKYFNEFKEMIATLTHVESNSFPAEFNEDDFINVQNIPGGKSLKETEVVKKWLDCDVFVNIPISKHHMTTMLTGALKNIMGVSTRKSNVTFHLGSGERNDPEYLAQCITDQNLLKRTDLCIIDSTEFIVDNGPSGPGTLKKPMKIVAGTDIVALDALTATFLDYQPDEILTVVKAHESGIGEMNFEKLDIIEITT